MNRFIRFTMAAVCAVVLAGPVAAQGVNITADFVDENFRAFVYERIGKEEGEPIYVSDVDTITSFNTGSRNIANLAGIEHFTMLLSLNVSANQLTEIDVSKNTALTTLNVHNNQLIELDVSANTALTELWVSHNQLTELDVSKNTALTELYVLSNQLTELDVSKNTALTQLRVSQNQLTELDVSNNTVLKHLMAIANQLTSIDVSANTALNHLLVGGNQLTSLDVSNNTALSWLSVESNQLTSLDVSNNTALSELNVSSNQLTTLDVSSTRVIQLYVRNNQLTTLDVSNKSMADLDVRENYMPNESAVIGFTGEWDVGNRFRFTPQRDPSSIGFTSARAVSPSVPSLRLSGRVLHVNFPSSGRLDIFALNGAKVRTLDLNQGIHTVRLSALPRGAYVIRASGGSWNRLARVVVR